MKRKCNFCKKEYRVYDEDAGTFKEHYCSEQCAIDADNELGFNPSMMSFDLPAEY